RPAERRAGPRNDAPARIDRNRSCSRAIRSRSIVGSLTRLGGWPTFVRLWGDKRRSPPSARALGGDRFTVTVTFARIPLLGSLSFSATRRPDRPRPLR